ncbi:MAG: glycogen synthase GlgA [Verrucomicrobiota bacterium]|nr:glycogen synthase GlgA [Verrucomicrobiota bacterium]
MAKSKKNETDSKPDKLRKTVTLTEAEVAHTIDPVKAKKRGESQLNPKEAGTPKAQPAPVNKGDKSLAPAPTLVATSAKVDENAKLAPTAPVPVVVSKKVTDSIIVPALPKVSKTQKTAEPTLKVTAPIKTPKTPEPKPKDTVKGIADSAPTKPSKMSLKKVSSPRVSDPLPKGGVGEKLKILFVSSECVPYAKTGGLGDVVAALPKAFARKGHEVRIVIPMFNWLDRVKYKISFIGSACAHMGNNEEHWFGVHEATVSPKIKVWFVEFARFFDRPGIYHNNTNDYPDNAYRFAFLGKAALQLCVDYKFIPDVVHGHDWAAAMATVYTKTPDPRLSPYFRDTAAILTIHNMAYQGVYPANVYPYLGVGWEHFNNRVFESFGYINLLKAGIFFADAVTTVSPTYAKEIREPVAGCGLAMYLNDRGDDVYGILNGVDYDDWNPETDRLIPANYSVSDLSGKVKCKQTLQSEMNLEPRQDWPVFGIVSRMVSQKGFDLLKETLPKALDRMVMQVVVLGTGDPAIENFFRWLAASYPGRVGVQIGFSNELSHLIEAGSDFFLMPSIFEPCGLNQMYSLRYGTLPLVRSTGGLQDTVENYDETTAKGTGFKFILPTALAVYDTIGWAVSTWFDRPHHIQQLRRQAMEKNFSWDKSSDEYLAIYRAVLDKKRHI